MKRKLVEHQLSEEEVSVQMEVLNERLQVSFIPLCACTAEMLAKLKRL
jgi:hypothetical protein